MATSGLFVLGVWVALVALDFYLMAIAPGPYPRLGITLLRVRARAVFPGLHRLESALLRDFANEYIFTRSGAHLSFRSRLPLRERGEPKLSVLVSLLALFRVRKGYICGRDGAPEVVLVLNNATLFTWLALAVEALVSGAEVHAAGWLVRAGIALTSLLLTASLPGDARALVSRMELLILPSESPEPVEAGPEAVARGSDGGGGVPRVVVPGLVLCCLVAVLVAQRALRAPLASAPTVGIGADALASAIATGRVDHVRSLLDHGVDVNQRRGADGGTPLMLAVTCLNARETVRTLLERGADVSATDAHGQTPLMFALGYRDLVHRRDRAADLVLEHGAAVDARDDRGRTALLRHVDQDSWMVDPEAVRLLLAHGADPNLADNFGTTALRAAELRKNASILALLKSRAAGVAPGSLLPPTPGGVTASSSLSLSWVRAKNPARAVKVLGNAVGPGGGVPLEGAAVSIPAGTWPHGVLGVSDDRRWFYWRQESALAFADLATVDRAVRRQPPPAEAVPPAPDETVDFHRLFLPSPPSAVAEVDGHVYVVCDAQSSAEAAPATLLEVDLERLVVTRELTLPDAGDRHLAADPWGHAVYVLGAEFPRRISSQLVWLPLDPKIPAYSADLAGLPRGILPLGAGMVLLTQDAWYLELSSPNFLANADRASNQWNHAYRFEPGGVTEVPPPEALFPFASPKSGLVYGVGKVYRDGRVQARHEFQAMAEASSGKFYMAYEPGDMRFMHTKSVSFHSTADSSQLATLDLAHPYNENVRAAFVDDVHRRLLFLYDYGLHLVPYPFVWAGGP